MQLSRLWFAARRLMVPLTVAAVLLTAVVSWAQELPGGGPEADQARRQVEHERIILRERLRRELLESVRLQRLALESRPNEEPGDDMLDDAPEQGRLPRGVALRPRMTAGEIFDHQVFGGTVGDRAVLEYLRRILDSRWKYVVRTREFNSVQERKLLLAGHGDIKRFLNRVRKQREEFEAGGADQQAWRTEFDSIRLRYLAGPFGDDSLFAKVLRKIEEDKREARPASGAADR